MSSDVLNHRPDGIPLSLARSPWEAYGSRVHVFPFIADPVKHVEDVRNLQMREDDVIIAAYPKSGTHWVWEVTHMLLHQTTEHERRTKEHLMLEATPDLQTIMDEPSPRIINSHLEFTHLPQEILTKRTKIIHLIRNPKDTLISLYYQYLAIASKFTVQALLDAAIQNKLMFPSQFDYLRQMSQFQQEHPDHPVLHIYYEEMNKDPDRIIRQLATFLDVAGSDKFLQEVKEACKFESLKKIEEDEKKELPENLDRLCKENNVKVKMIRKGIVGDWKNELTKDQSDQLDAYIAREMDKGLDFNFIYE
ncbi:sulfotransferase 1B1-like [Biomphalaria glabrata]|uniref:Sulfotransferase 1B1-like n=1 Tax=Biomphalaria glabrata TaxID=6526 RepID=A0A9W2YHN2_BIOGL